MLGFYPLGSAPLTGGLNRTFVLSLRKRVKYPEIDNNISGASDLWDGDFAGGILLADYFNEVAVSSGIAGYVKVYIGSVWVDKPVKVWNGSAWVQKPIKFYNGAWTLA